MLILERSQDPVTPILHEFTYQAMANDLLEETFQDSGTGGGGKLMKYTTDENLKKEIALDDSDSIWMQTRHIHIAQVIEQVNFRIITRVNVGNFILLSFLGNQGI